MRARATQDTLSAFSQRVDDGRARLVARIPAEALAQIEHTPSSGWIPVDVEHHVPTAILGELGRDGAYAFFRGHLQRQLASSPLLKSTIAATIRLFGLTPASLARATPVGWDAAFRDFCRVRAIQRGSDSAVILLEDVAEQVFAYPAYVETFRGLFAGFADFCGVTGDAEASANEREREIEIVLRWVHSAAAG